MQPLQVARSTVQYKPKGSETLSKRIMQYADVPLDKDGWADASQYLPLDCDLVAIEMDSGIIKKGWITGHTWDGFKIKDDDKVLRWKKVLHSY